jgi:hypothetical protein
VVVALDGHHLDRRSVVLAGGFDAVAGATA